jgi:hypothetical protein
MPYSGVEGFGTFVGGFRESIRIGFEGEGRELAGRVTIKDGKFMGSKMRKKGLEAR